MPEEELPSLWLYGEMEPWKRGRNILIGLAIFQALVQLLVFSFAVAWGTMEWIYQLALAFVLSWLLFAFVWFGTHWLRWLLGAWAFLCGLAGFVWGIRDQSIIVWSCGVLNFFVGASYFAPSVHHFARRQKENIRWPEKLIVGGALLLLAGSCGAALAVLGLQRTLVQREGARYGETSLQRIFVENDTYYLLGEASEEWLHQPAGNLGVTAPLTDKLLRLGAVENVRVTKVELHPIYRFPLAFAYSGFIDGEGQGRCGAVALRLQVWQTPRGWRINGFWWRCWDPSRF